MEQLKRPAVRVGVFSCGCSEHIAGRVDLEALARELKALRDVAKDREKKCRGALQQTGINPYLMQMANIRERSTLSTQDPARTHDECRALVKGTIRRVVLHEELRGQTLIRDLDMVVIGGDIGGIEAALIAAQVGRQVTVIESGPTVGGVAMQLEELAPQLECAPCLLAPRLAALQR